MKTVEDAGAAIKELNGIVSRELIMTAKRM